MPSDAPLSTLSAREVVFVVGTEAITIKPFSYSASAICDTARTLKAGYFVALDGDGWGVFDMRRADPNGGGPRQWLISDPIRVFPRQDAAVMFALARAGSSR